MAAQNAALGVDCGGSSPGRRRRTAGHDRQLHRRVVPKDRRGKAFAINYGLMYLPFR